MTVRFRHFDLISISLLFSGSFHKFHQLVITACLTSSTSVEATDGYKLTMMFSSGVEHVCFVVVIGRDFVDCGAYESGQDSVCFNTVPFQNRLLRNRPLITGHSKQTTFITVFYKRVVLGKTVARKFSIGGYCVCAGVLDILKIDKNLNGVSVSFVSLEGQAPRGDGTGSRYPDIVFFSLYKINFAAE